MDSKQMAAAYKNRQIMTASPEELTLMLYNGAIRFGIEAKKALENHDFEAANEASIRVQNIVTELSNTLDMQYKISVEWKRIYEYISYTLVQANVKKDSEKLEEALGLIREFRDTWQEAIKLARTQNGAKHTPAMTVANRWA